MIDSCLWCYDPAPRTPICPPTTGKLQIGRKVLIRCGRGIHLPFHPPPHIQSAQRYFITEIMPLKYYMTVMLWNACFKHDVSLLSMHLQPTVTLMPTNALDVRRLAHACKQKPSRVLVLSLGEGQDIRNIRKQPCSFY